MRIIKRGVTFRNGTADDNWVYEVELTCHSCDTQFKIEPNDKRGEIPNWRDWPWQKKSVYALHRHQNGQSYDLWARCPECGANIHGRRKESDDYQDPYNVDRIMASRRTTE